MGNAQPNEERFTSPEMWDAQRNQVRFANAIDVVNYVILNVTISPIGRDQTSYLRIWWQSLKNPTERDAAEFLVRFREIEDAYMKSRGYKYARFLDPDTTNIISHIIKLYEATKNPVINRAAKRAVQRYWSPDGFIGKRIKAGIEHDWAEGGPEWTKHDAMMTGRAKTIKKAGKKLRRK